MSGLEALGAASAVLTILETAIGLVRQVQKANERRKDLSTLLGRHTQELARTKSIIQIVSNEDALQTASVASELVEMGHIAKRLTEVLCSLQNNRGPVKQFFHQLLYGAKDESVLARMMDELSRAKSNLTLRIGVAHVGLTRTAENTLVVNTAMVKRIDNLLQPVLENGQGLKISRLVQDRSPQNNGFTCLTESDIASLNDNVSPFAGNSTTIPFTRIVVDNLTEEQALQINGPVGKQEWYIASRLEIKENKATGTSIQINDGISMDAFKSLMEHRRQPSHNINQTE